MLLTKKSFTYKPWLDTGFLTIENTTEKEKYTGNDWNKKLYCKCKVETCMSLHRTSVISPFGTA